MRALLALLASSCLALGCSSSPSAPLPGPDDASAPKLRFSMDAAVSPGTEAYLCFFVDGSAWAGQSLDAIGWDTPEGPVVLHHATLMATPSTHAPGSIPCDEMPAAFSVLGLRAPGKTEARLPPGVAMAVPVGTRGLVLEAHVLRVGDGTPAPLVLSLSRSVAPPEHLASWVAVTAPIPVIRPHDVASSQGSCRFSTDAHVVLDWPHMHRLGRTFHGRIVRADGSVERLVDVDPWRFDDQPSHAVDVTLAAGDTVETECHWENPTDDFHFAGPLSSDEMCNQGLVVWPQASVVCEP